MIDLVPGSGVRGSGRRFRPDPRAARATAARTRVALGLAWQAAPWTLLGTVLIELISGIAPVASAWLIAVAVDGLTEAPATVPVGWLGLGFAAVTLVLTVGVPVQRYLEAELSRSVAIRAKDRLYQTVRAFTLLSTLERPEFRDRLRLAEQACRSGPGQVVTSLLASVRATVTLIGLLATVLAIMPVLGLAMCVAMAPALMAELRLSRERAAMMWRISPTERREFFYTELLTSLSAAKETRLFGAGRMLHGRMLAELGAVNLDRRRHDRRELRTHGVLALLSGGLAGGALFAIVWSAANGTITPGEVGAAVVAIGTLLATTASLVAQLAAGHHAGLLLDHYREVIAMPIDSVGANPVDTCSDTSMEGDIELVDVWFRYGPDQPWVLRGVNLTIRAGHAMAVVGENGSGKSTLVKLLCRFYDPTRGSIRWGGTDLRDLPVDEVRRRIGAVFQDFMSYELTAKENIALGDVDDRAELDLSPDRIVAAADRAGIAEAFDERPRGLDTMLSRTFVDHAGDADATGVLLSGGQWQRLALARALLRGQRELLILDEPSSGLDAIAEHHIHTQLAAYRQGRTSVLVSHRLNTVRDADEIVVLAGGQVVEQGTHRGLLAADGAYARLFLTQAAGYAEETPADLTVR